MSFNRVDFPDPLTPTRPVRPGPKAMSRPSKTGVPSGQEKASEVQVREADMWVSAVARSEKGQTRIETPATTGEDQETGGRGQALLVGNGSYAEVARGAHTSGV
ncbi:hypothetical protein M2163_007784 [Streptomyces sp. SAI-135]|nr:hypothetical protein [Streptomyces sp. SAI-135]